jgi:hypothetical protein
MSGDEGDIELLQCFDVNGQYEVLGHTESAPSPISVTLTTWAEKASQYLERVVCPFFLHVNKRCSGPANVIDNYTRAVILKIVKRNNRAFSGMVMRNEDAESEQAFGLSAYPPFLDVYNVTSARQTTAETQTLNDVIFVNDYLCGDCTTRYDQGMIGMAVADNNGAATPNILYTLDGGGTWTPCAADPFSVSEAASCATYVWLDKERIRFIVGRGTTDAGNPAEIAYTDFNVNTDIAIGAAWDMVNVGATNAQFFYGPRALYSYDQFNIWGVAGAGYIYKSEDAGITWTTQEAGALTVNDYYVIRFAPGSALIGYATGENNAMARTYDGGVTWSAVVGPGGLVENLCMDVRSDKVVYVGDDTGDLYVTYDGALTWEALTHWVGAGTGTVQAIEFLNDMLGYMLTNSAGFSVGSLTATLHITRDAGRTWLATPAFDNDGMMAMDVIRPELVFMVGAAVNAGTSAIYKTNG